jgi:hypothetical protein
MKHHNSDDWYQLNKSEIVKFQVAHSFAKFMLGTSDDLNCMLMYSHIHQRMDVKFKNNDCMIAVQYEPGYPVTYFDEDRWN